jgi:hypothetical protein
MRSRRRLYRVAKAHFFPDHREFFHARSVFCRPYHTNLPENRALASRLQLIPAYAPLDIFEI